MKSFNLNKLYKAFIVLIIMLIVSCAKDETTTTVDYTGSWTCVETATNPAGTTTFTIHLKKNGTSETAYYMENIYNLGFSVQASLTISGNSITIAQQSVGSGTNHFNTSGSGSVTSSTKISLSYKMDDGSGAIDNCTATLTKQ